MIKIQSIESLANSLSMGSESLNERMPGPFVDYDEEKDRSCEVSLASSAGYIKKVKERKLERTIYEFLCLAVWNDILREYSKANSLRFKAPAPVCLTEMSPMKSGLIMTYLPGNKLRALTNMKKNTPVRIKGQKTPLPLYAACALHLGAINRIKEEEKLVHGDYDDRHVFFHVNGGPTSVGIIDVENSCVGSDPNQAIEESRTILQEFLSKKSASEQETETLRAWYSRGVEELKLPRGKSQIDNCIWGIGKKYGVDFDMVNRTVNGYFIPSNRTVHPKL